MDVIDKLFADLESNNVQRADESKKRLCELFAQTKESWLVIGMMDYFGQTNSARIVDVLVKVQQPHDKHIFDRLCDWLHTVHRQQAIMLFGHIVKRHPSWLYKVASHPFLRDILRLLKSDTNIISAMNALFCIIILLPIIPTAMPQYLADLFDIFLYLAAWNCHHQPRLTEDQAIHLQIGLSAYFQRMYGMYPCNFVAYLRDYVQKEQLAVFQHTVRPLLETVKMHPMLLTSNRELEKANGRWKEMEPHDVVVECSRFSLDYQTRGAGAALVAAGRSGELLMAGGADAVNLISECPYYKIMSGRSVNDTPISQQLRRLLKNTPSQASSLSSPFYSPFSETNDSSTEPQRIDNIWSPLWSVMATPPPLTSNSGAGGGAPPTPTPSLGGATCYTMKPIGGGMAAAVAVMPTNINHPQQTMQKQQQLCVSGSSPPEAAVEATPETTPMKEQPLCSAHARPFPVNSPAVRAIWGLPTQQLQHQQPTSPLRRDLGSASAFRFQPSASGGDSVATNAMAIASPKILSFVNERNMYASQLLRDGASGGAPALQPTTSSNNNASGGGIGAFSTTGIARRQPLASAADSTPEDAEVTQINSLAVRPPLPPQARFKRSPNGNTTTTPITTTTKASLSTELSSDADRSTVDSDADASETVDGADEDNNDDEDADGANGNSARRLQSKRSHFAGRKCERITIGTQTIQQLPQSYEQMFLDLLAGTADAAPAPATEACTAADIVQPPSAAVPSATTAAVTSVHQRAAPPQSAPAAPVSPYDLLDQYIQNVHRSPNATSTAATSNANNDQIQLLQLQLQFERYRREVHAERNRRLLGKSRVNAALEMDNQKLSEQRDRLAAESDELTAALNRARVQRTAQENEHDAAVQRLQRDVLAERVTGAELRAGVETLQRSETDERRLRQAAIAELAACKAEMFDMRNELAQTQERAEYAVRCREEMQRLQQEVLLMGEIQVKCRERLAEMNGWQTREAEAALVRSAYVEEVREIRSTLDTKAAQLDTARARLTDLEAQLSRRDSMFTDQKRLLKTVKEEYQDRFRALEAKYTAQKAVILRLEEEMLDLYHRNQSATGSPGGGGGGGDDGNAGGSAVAGGSASSSADVAGGAVGGGSGSVSSQQTPDADRHSVVGSLDHASPLSVSLASSEGLAISLRSTATEIRNLHPLVTVAPNSEEAVTDGGRTIDQQHATGTRNTRNSINSGGNNSANNTAHQPDGGPTTANRQPVSDDIPVPTASVSSTVVVSSNPLHLQQHRGSLHHHHHQLHKHQHL